MKVTVYHPKLENREVTVYESQVRILENSGWVRKGKNPPLVAKSSGPKPPPLNAEKE